MLETLSKIIRQNPEEKCVPSVLHRGASSRTKKTSLGET